MKSQEEIESDLSMVFDKESENSGWSREISRDLFNSKSLNLLISYYQQLNSQNEKDIYVAYIQKHFNRNNTSALSFLVFFQLGLRDYALDNINIDNSASFIKLIYELFNKNINWFNNNELLKLKNKLPTVLDNVGQQTRTRANYIESKIIDRRYENFENKIQGIDIEIIGDKQQVEEYLKNFGFEEKYNITLNKIEQYIQSEGDDGEIVGASVLGTFREFFKYFYIDLAKKIATLNGLDEVPKNKESTTEIGHARNYLKKEFNLSSEEHNFIDNYKDICTNSGAHALLSEKKYLRLARNIGIEIALFMLQKFEDYSKSLN